MADYYNSGRSFVREEIEDIIIADLILSLGFALVLSGGLANAAAKPYAFLALMPITIMAVTLSFVLHEYMHKLAAKHFGAVAAFRKSTNGIFFTIMTALFGFLIGVPGATIIYTSTFTRREEGYVSLAGPLTNFAVFIVFFIISIVYSSALQSSQYLNMAVSVTLFISILLAFFNMLPVYPLDGSKVFRWNKGVFAIMMLITFVFFFIAATLMGIPAILFMIELAFILIIALVMSLFFNSFRF
ncbi:MAG: site-2 protease family protein [Candidatus Micrarchaeota archaeon]|nr:site-2 protease family protein [Candidatus Micrarchaeota archaeon]